MSTQGDGHPKVVGPHDLHQAGILRVVQTQSTWRNSNGIGSASGQQCFLVYSTKCNSRNIRSASNFKLTFLVYSTLLRTAGISDLLQVNRVFWFIPPCLEQQEYQICFSSGQHCFLVYSTPWNSRNIRSDSS